MQRAGIDSTDLSDSDVLPLFLNVAKKFPSPVFKDVASGRVSVDGFSVNKNSFMRRAMHSLESRGEINNDTWIASCHSAAINCGKKETKKSIHRIEKIAHIGWVSTKDWRTGP
jgi:hypothetical protein